MVTQAPATTVHYHKYPYSKEWYVAYKSAVRKIETEKAIFRLPKGTIPDKKNPFH